MHNVCQKIILSIVLVVVLSHVDIATADNLIKDPGGFVKEKVKDVEDVVQQGGRELRKGRGAIEAGGKHVIKQGGRELRKARTAVVGAIEEPDKVLQPIGKGIAHAWEEGTDEGMKLLGKIIVWFFASDEPISETDWNPEDGVSEYRREFQIVDGKAGVKIEGADQLREVIVQIWKWESEPNAEVIIQQPGAAAQIVVKRFDHSGENVWHQIKYDTTAQNTPFDRKSINGNWRITIPGQSYGASLLLTVTKKE